MLPSQGALQQCVDSALAETQRVTLEGGDGGGGDVGAGGGGEYDDAVIKDAVRVGAGKRRTQRQASAKQGGECVRGLHVGCRFVLMAQMRPPRAGCPP